jgi:ubiquitin C-terminal hydrolase
VPLVRFFCSALPLDLSTFEYQLFQAINAIVKTRDQSAVSSFFPSVKDCDGVQHRYGQIAVPDFLEYLVSRSSRLSEFITFPLTTRLQCSGCNSIRDPSSSEIALKLYFPSNKKLTTLEDLVDFNSKASLDYDNTVYCSTCSAKTLHSYSRSCNPDLFFIELFRVTTANHGMFKNKDPISFSAELKLPGFSRSYRVVASAHHRGSLHGGHWFTKLCTTRGWLELDDLRKKHVPTDPPGVRDTSVAVLLVIAEDKLS